MRSTIYIDMDGVVADFDGYVSKQLGRSVHWTDRTITKSEWAELTAIGDLYWRLPLLANATALVGYCSSIEPKYNVEFLTALPSKTTMPEAEDDKTRWIKKYFPTYKVNFGPFSTDKWKWCKPGDILIDDRVSNIATARSASTGCSRRGGSTAARPALAGVLSCGDAYALVGLRRAVRVRGALRSQWRVARARRRQRVRGVAAGRAEELR